MNAYTILTMLVDKVTQSAVSVCFHSISWVITIARQRLKINVKVKGLSPACVGVVTWSV